MQVFPKLKANIHFFSPFCFFIQCNGKRVKNSKQISLNACISWWTWKISIFGLTITHTITSLCLPLFKVGQAASAGLKICPGTALNCCCSNLGMGKICDNFICCQFHFLQEENASFESSDWSSQLKSRSFKIITLPNQIAFFYHYKLVQNAIPILQYRKLEHFVLNYIYLKDNYFGYKF